MGDLEVVFIGEGDLGVAKDLADGAWINTLTICIGGPGAPEVVALDRGPFSVGKESFDSLLQKVGWVFLAREIEDEVGISFVLFSLQLLDYLDQVIAGVGEAAFFLLLRLDDNSTYTFDSLYSGDVLES